MSLRARLCLAVVLAAGPAAAEEMPDEQFRQGMALLTQWLVKRGEDRATVDVFMGSISAGVKDDDGDGRVPVTKAVFDAFVRYERAWQRARKDAQAPGDIQEKLRKLDEAKKAFDRIAQAESPIFYAAFKKAGAASRRHRQARGMGIGGGAGSSVFAGHPPGGADAEVDAGVEALQQGDPAKALAAASKAIAQNPKESEAYALRAAANFDLQDLPAAAKDARAALELDPGNLQAQAILGMSASAPAPAPAASGRAAAEAASVARNLESPGPVAGRIQGLVDLQSVHESALQASRMNTATPLDADAGQGLPALAPFRSRGGVPAPGRAGPGYSGRIDPAEAYFERARAAADAGDRQGVIFNLREAAHADAAYEPFLQAAIEAPDDLTLADLFRSGTPWDAARAKKGRDRSPLMIILLGLAGGLLLVGGYFFLGSGKRFRRGGRARPKSFRPRR